MEKAIKNIKFLHKKNANAQFDIVNLHELYQRKNLDHSIESNHKVLFYILLFVEEGEGYHTIDFKDYKISKGSILTIRKDQIHKFFKNNDIKASMLIFTNEFLLHYLEQKEVQKSMLLFNELIANQKIQLNKLDFTNVHQNIQRIEEEYFTKKDEHSKSIIRSELHILLTKLYRIKLDESQVKFGKKYLKEFLEFQELVEQNVQQTKKVDDYAKQLAKSSKTLNTITKSILHKSAKAFIDEISVKQIKRLLINTELSIKEIAYQSGFEETTNFYKYFKRHTNTTPEKFRTSK